MKRLILVATLAAALVVPGLAHAANAGTIRVNRTFTPTASGTTFLDGTTTRLLLNVKNALEDPGSASLTLTPSGASTIAKGSIYTLDGALRVRIVLSVAPDAINGANAITGTGKVLSGTSSYVRARGSFKVSGTRTTAGVYALKLKGHVAYDVPIPVTGSGRGQ